MLFMFQIKTKTYLVFISMVVINSACHCYCTDRHLKVRSNSILFTFWDKGELTSARDWQHHALHAKRLAYDIVRYVSKFQRSDRHN